jgi:hypothetical protein
MAMVCQLSLTSLVSQDFSPYAKAIVPLPNPGVSDSSKRAWEVLKKQDPAKYRQFWPRNHDFHWHHAPNGKMQLVDKDLHTAFQHTGLNSILDHLGTAAIVLIPGAQEACEGRFGAAGKAAVDDAFWGPSLLYSDFWSWLLEFAEEGHAAPDDKFFDKIQPPE